MKSKIKKCLGRICSGRKCVIAVLVIYLRHLIHVFAVQ